MNQMNTNPSQHAALVVAAMIITAIVAGNAQAGFTTSLGAQANFLEPDHWSVGDPGTTHQVWDARSSLTGNAPDHAYNVAGATLTDPTQSAAGPAFYSSNSKGFYSFSGNYNVSADIFNHGGVGNGTHVIVQIGGSVNPDVESFGGHGTSALTNTIEVVQHDGTGITGGDNASALRIDELAYQTGVPTNFGPVNYHEIIAEFWLDGWTGDFRVQWTEMIHTTQDTLRVDSAIASQAFDVTAVPEPASVALLGVGAVLVGMRRKRRTL